MVLAALTAGCTAAGSTVTATGSTLTVYASQPPGGGGLAAQDVLDGERLALSQQGGRVGQYAVRMVTLDGTKISDNARRAIEDKGAIAYLGEIVPGSSEGSVGITNSQDLLQVSPTDTALELTQTSPAVSDSPTVYYESTKTYGHTFARVVPTDAREAKAVVAEMSARGVSRLYVAIDGSDYGKALSAAVTKAAAGSITLVRASSQADGMLFAGTSATDAAKLFNGAASGNPSVKLFAPSAPAFDAGFVSALSPGAARQLEVSSPGFLPSDLPATASQQFVTPFRTAYGHAPSAGAIFGYEAMSALLSVLRKAGSAANNRSTVVRDFFAIRNRPSVIGTYSINAVGDTSLGAFVFSRVRGGQLVPFKSVQEG
jgi:branched-chain amino acid transport system substrate-binding protein